MSKAAAKLEKVRVERDRLFSIGRYYEALQLYKTLYSRACVKKSWAEAEEIVVEGATALLQQGQANSGGELALLLIELFTKSKQVCESEQAKTILLLASHFPTDNAAGVESKINFLKASIKWSSTVGAPNANSGSGGNSSHVGCGFPDFHLALARVQRSQKDFPSAHQNYLRAGGASALIHLSEPSESISPAYYAGVEYTECGQNLVQWWEEGGGLPSELDLFLTRAVLQYLCLEDMAGPQALLKWFKSQFKEQLSEEPLFHFLTFLLEVLQRSKEAAPLFDVLQAKYSLALSRDPNLQQYLEKIGEVFFGREAPKGMMESMLSGLTGAGPSSSSSSSSSSSNLMQQQIQETPASAPTSIGDILD